MKLTNIYFVLVRTFSSGNIGSSVRALKNFGLADNLRLVSPLNYNENEIEMMAAGASDKISAINIYNSLKDSVNDISFIIGTTARKRNYHKVISITEALEEISEISDSNKVAFLFGNETNGLTEDEISIVQKAVTIPTSPNYSSLNLSQAVLLVAYELFKQMHTPTGYQSKQYKRFMKLAAYSDKEKLFESFSKLLHKLNFLKPISEKNSLYYWKLTLERVLLTKEEVKNLFSLIKVIEKKLSNENE